MPLVAASLHLFEEYVWPGGFPDWYRRYKPARAHRLTRGFFLAGNSLLLGVCCAVGFLRSMPFIRLVWLGLAALLATNAIWHLIGSLKTRSYSPGVVTGLVLYVPMAAFGWIQVLR